MSNTLANGTMPQGAASRERVLARQLRDVLGIDPFNAIRASVGFDYDVRRTETGYHIELPVPGYNSSNIEVAVKDEILSVEGKNDRGTFSRSFTIPEDVDADRTEAAVADGILTMTLVRRPEKQPTKIPVK